MYISACKETKELVESDFIEASKIEEDIIQKSQFYQVYKDFLKSTDENFYEALKTFFVTNIINWGWSGDHSFKNKHCEVLVSCSDRMAFKSCH